MSTDVRQTVAAARPPRGDGGDVVGAGSTVHRLGPDRAGLSSRSRWPESSSASRWGSDSFRSVASSVVFEFTAAWERGDSPAVEDYLRRLDPADHQGAVDLIYREYCLAEADGRAPDADAYVARFPRLAEALRGLFRVHGACSPSMLARLMGPPPSRGLRPLGDPGPGLPEAGDSIGPYLLRRELGRGSFARVFLAEQADLANRLVVVKIATRATREPWLLARARHAHIVEILSHAQVDDGAFQLICMPFWGGATLADVLAAPALASPPPGRGRGPTAAADLLAALDAVGAPEYPSVHPARPAREILAPLSFDRAIAWVIARLAEALDHAHSRGVSHGDIKPSNILLSADGSPMLLDFNLAREGAPALDPSGRPIDPGGTLAYMAPERLRALASAGSPTAGEPGGETGGAGWPPDVEDEHPTLVPGPDGRSSGAAAHVSDLYSLGMVLLEALSGRAPSVPEAAAASRTARLFSAARAYAEARERPAAAMIGDFGTASGRPIAPALRAILGRCLDPDPARRYRRALELAEDLDRWRTDRPLAYAEEPFWGQAVPRWLRVRRRKLILTAASILALGLGTIAVFQVGSNRLLLHEAEASAANKYALWLDEPESGAFLHSQRIAAPRAWEANDPEAFEVARRALLDYGVIGPGGVADGVDWRTRDDVRYLPAADREDLELWLMERTYRYCLAMADRPDSPDDWRQALDVLDRAVERRPIRAFAPLRDRLAARLGRPALPRAAASAPDWLDEHLLGFASECRSGLIPAPAPSGDPARDRRSAVEGALGHYERALAIRPWSFWAHHRAASACFGLGRASDAARHLALCLERRPDNATVRAQLARCLIALGYYSEALEHCDRALERAPRFAEVYRTRAYTRAVSRQTGGLEDDLRHFEMFSRVLPSSRWGGPEPADPLKDAGLAEAAFPRLADLGPAPAWRRGRREAVDAGPEEVAARATLGDALGKAELLPLARDEFEKILVIQPDHIPSRIRRVEAAFAEGRFEGARPELVGVLDDPGLDDYVRDNPGSLVPLFSITRQYLKAGRVEDAQRVVEQARELAVRYGRDVGRAHYQSAQVYAVLGASDPSYIDQAAGQLFRAFIAHPDFLKWYRKPNPWFDPVRARIDAALGRLEDPEAVRRRMTARSTTPARPRSTDRVAGR